MRHGGESGIALISPSSNVSVSVFTNAPLSDSCMDDVSCGWCTRVYWQAREQYVCVRVSCGYMCTPSRRREINGSRNCHCRGLGGRNSVSNTVLAPLMNGWQGRTCGVGRLTAKGIRGERVESRWRGTAVATRRRAPLPPRWVCIRVACGSEFRSRGADASSGFLRNRNSRRPDGAGRDGWWRSKGEIRSTKTRRG